MSSSNTQVKTAGVQYGNTYGGAVSLYYGFRAASSLQVWDVTSSFTNNICHSAVISARVGIGGNAYGGCLSVYAGAWNVRATGGSSFGSGLIDSMRVFIDNNSVTNCSASITMYELANGTNVYGGGISIAMGAYSWAELVVTAYSSLGLCICVSADGGMSPNSCFFHLLEGMDWGGRLSSVVQRCTSQQSCQLAGSGKDMTTLRPCHPTGAFKFSAGHLPYKII
jgi:hypothetical protein